ncbi:hypothetical protein EVC03_041 [Rhizobium phage RHph_Y5A]|nr:hypothetical protein EVC03_041 [Rhizobium phage RHph_Y5A]QIG75483.1 hypothetical protein EVC18_041 [Rhizobium phage RHph_Y2_4]
MKRIIMGEHPGLNETGVFVSHPGFDVDNITVPFLLDSRWKGLDILTTGRKKLSRQESGSEGGQAIYYTAVTVPDQGFMPQYYGNVIYASGNFVGIPVNTSYWPDAGISHVVNQTTDFNVRAGGVWMPASNVICCQFNIAPSGVSGDMYLYYIIFRNPRDAS